MAKPRDRVYTSVRVIDVAQLFAADEGIMFATLLTALQEQMTEVATKMEAEGAYPNPNAVTELVLTFQAKGGPHHVRQDQQSDQVDSDGSGGVDDRGPDRSGDQRG